MTLHIVPITLRDAQAYVEQHHRHHGPPRGHLWSIGATDDRPSRPRTDTHPTGPKTRWRHRLET